MEILAMILVAVLAIVGGVVHMRHGFINNPSRVDGLRRRDGSYADYDFPGIWNGGRLRDYFFPRVHSAADVDSVEQAASNVDLYGRPLSSAIVAKREAESRIEANPDVQMRPVQPSDWEAVLQILVPVIRNGDTYALPQDMSVEEIHRVWIELPQQVYVAIFQGEIVGTCYLKNNQLGGGSHVCNCGFMVLPEARGLGVAKTMGLHAQEVAKQLGYRAMQFNFVVSTNVGAIQLWKKLGFEIVGRLPQAFQHPQKGFVDALVMFKSLVESRASSESRDEMHLRVGGEQFDLDRG
ncbi:GNAT family N-acetyltransferase [Bremerella cremea]|uniref:GNAT family N-acetyltransferase n=1 Tax=Bremerella cremea TaxID=1031537 RepID=UPI0031EA9CF4